MFRHNFTPASVIRIITLGVLLSAILFPAWSGAAPRLFIEPGLPVDGYWLLPLGILDETGASVDFHAEDLRLERAGNSVKDFTLKTVAPAAGGEPVVLAILLGGLGVIAPTRRGEIAKMG